MEETTRAVSDFDWRTAFLLYFDPQIQNGRTARDVDKGIFRFPQEFLSRVKTFESSDSCTPAMEMV